MNDIGSKGCFIFKLCHPFLNDRHEYGNLVHVDEQLKLAAECMQEIIESAKNL